jgi:hypothetical protein
VPKDGKAVIGMSSFGWTDDELLSELRAALSEPPVDENIIRAAEAAFNFRLDDAELELLILADDCDFNAVLVRGTGPRLLTFHGERLSVTVEVDESGIIGQLTPSGAGQVTLMTTDGPQAVTDADEVGYFSLPPPASAPIRLDCTVGDDRFVTEWATP